MRLCRVDASSFLAELKTMTSKFTKPVHKDKHTLFTVHRRTCLPDCLQLLFKHLTMMERGARWQWGIFPK